MVDGTFEVSACVKHAADDNTDNQGRINLFGDKGKCDGNDRRKKRPERCVGLDRFTNLFDSRRNVGFEVGVGFKVVGVGIDISVSRVAVRKVVVNRILTLAERELCGCRRVVCRCLCVKQYLYIVRCGNRRISLCKNRNRSRNDESHDEHEKQQQSCFAASVGFHFFVLLYK